MSSEYSDDTADIPVEAGSVPIYACCNSCGSVSPSLYTDAGLDYWVTVHLCNVPPALRQWFTADVGEEVGD